MKLLFCRFAALAAVAFLGATAADAESRNWPWPSDRFNRTDQRNVAGVFDYYALVLSWSPSYCATANDGGDASQCNRSDGKRFSFVLHGLWPQYERGYPNDCRLPRRPFVPEDTIASMMDIMPSRGLIIHEYRKHGTCSGLDANGYFGTARKLFQSIKIPKRFDNPFEAQFIPPAEIVDEFARANPGLPRQSMAVSCVNGRPSQLRELRFCFSRDGAPRACGQNENARKLCASDTVFVPPSRSTARNDAATGSNRAPDATGAAKPLPPQKPLPKPRMLDMFKDI